MQTFWEDELTSEEKDALIERAAEQVARRGMETPAILFLEMHKPVMGLAANGMLAFSPFTVPFLGFDAVNDYSRIMRDRDAVERLIVRIEDMRASREGAH